MFAFFRNPTRFIFICRWRNIGVIDDDFFHVFLTILFTSLPAYLAFLVWLAEGHKSPLWHKCIGDHSVVPEPGENLLTFLPVLLFGLFSLVLHFGVFVTIERSSKNKYAVATSCKEEKVSQVYQQTGDQT